MRYVDDAGSLSLVAHETRQGEWSATPVDGWLSPIRAVKRLEVQPPSSEMGAAIGKKVRKSFTGLDHLFASCLACSAASLLPLKCGIFWGDERNQKKNR